MKKFRRHIAVLLSILALGLSAPQLSAQGGTRPTPCPGEITERTLGILEFWHRGYKWPGRFKLRMAVANGQGYYVPGGGTSYLISLNGKGIWDNAGLIVNCQAEEWFDAFGLHVDIWYHVHQYLGRVRERCEGSGAGGNWSTEVPMTGPYENEEYGSSIYDPYQTTSPGPNYVDPAYYMEHGNYIFTPLYSEADFESFSGHGSCGGGSTGGGSSGGGGSSAGEGDTWPGAGGTTCHYEYLVVEVSYDDGETWSVLWEGTTAVCE
jgi:hypothetical protein